MRIRKVLVELKTEEKIFRKHGVSREEIECALLEGMPRYFKTRGKKHVAITHHVRHITIVFSYSKGFVRIATAYPSSEWQVRLYERK